MRMVFGGVFFVIMLLGAFVSAVVFKDALMYMSGKTVDINYASIEDLENESIAEGDITYVDGHFATYEEKDSRFGLGSGTHEAYYYIVENISMEDMKKLIDGEISEAPHNYFAYVVSVSSEDLKRKLDANYEGWNDFFDGKTTEMPEPVHFEGKLWQEPYSDEYINIKNEALKVIGFDASEVAELKVVDNKPDAMSLGLFIGGIVVALIGLIVIIASFVSSRRRASEELYY